MLRSSQGPSRCVVALCAILPAMAPAGEAQAPTAGGIGAAPASFPRVWVTYRKARGLDEDIRDLLAHGVGAIAAGGSEGERADLVSAARRHGIRLIMQVPDVSEQAWTIPPEKVERAVMIAGALDGKAIDRHRFRFEALPQEVTIESPVYDRENCYGTLGRYFPGMREPLRGEVIVKEADFDGAQHIRVIPARLRRRDETHWTMRFDLTGVKGDLESAIVAVYWISEGTRSYWMFGDAASAAAPSTREAVAAAVRREVRAWRKANGGEFPSDLIFALRYGDECFHASGHLNGPECSYPLWDYSQSAIALFRARNPRDEVPRGKPWPDVFGRRAHADWMYVHHRACADLIRVVKETLRGEGLPDLLVFRNVTRSGVFCAENDHDGSGLDMLVRELDVAHLDPYPVKAGGYQDALIPIDMSYVAGLARRHGKLLVPWLQAHTYWPERGGLTHPSASQISRMLAQHASHRPDAIMWLGYGRGYTFPDGEPEAWRAAGREHASFFAPDRPPVRPRFLAVRPYTVRSLRDVDGNSPLDAFFTETILHDAVVNRGWAYDPLEPFDGASVDPADLRRYPLVLAELGELTGPELAPFEACDVPCILFVQGADRFSIDAATTGIAGAVRDAAGSGLRVVPAAGEPFAVEAADLFDLVPGARVEAGVGSSAGAWRKGKLLFVALRSARRDRALPDWLWKVAPSPQ